jgi:putative DNA primase/helicase
MQPFALNDGEGAVIVPPPSDPMAVARQFVAELYMSEEGVSLLRTHKGDFFAWSGSCWPEHEDDRVKADVYAWLEHAFYARERTEGLVLVPWEPTRYKVANVLDAITAVTHLDASVSAPAWLDGGAEPATETVALANGLLNLRTRTLVPHTPLFYSPNALQFPYDPSAPPPRRWQQFLLELWGDDRESIATLAEVMGYVLSGETNQQKMFLFVGPKRSGKGTIGRVLTGLLGAYNTAAPTLSSLTSNFGLSPLISRPLAIISDARLSNRADNMIAVERLLSISGEDTLTVDRKYRTPWSGRLPTRFLILTNELPRFADASGALASRFVLLVMRDSFYGREDPRLTDALLAEAPAIFNWALEGLDRLLDRGHFSQPESAREALRHLEDLSSPIGAFVRDSCEVGPGFEVGKDRLFQAWKAWCESEGRDRPGSKAVFTRDLRAAVPGLKPRRLGSEQRQHVLQGLRLKIDQQSFAPLTTPDREGNRQGSSGVSVTASPVDVDQDELERLASRARQ